jgi:hypothetical protein
MALNISRSRRGAHSSSMTGLNFGTAMVPKIRPLVKSLFPDNTVAVDPTIAVTFRLTTAVSKTSVINGFA